MKNKHAFKVYEINDKNDYSIDFMRTIQIQYNVGDKANLAESIQSFLIEHDSKYKDYVEIQQYLTYLEKNGYIELGEHIDGFPIAIFKQKGVDFIKRNLSIYGK